MIFAQKMAISRPFLGHFHTENFFSISFLTLISCFLYKASTFCECGRCPILILMKMTTPKGHAYHSGQKHDTEFLFCQSCLKNCVLLPMPPLNSYRPPRFSLQNGPASTSSSTSEIKLPSLTKSLGDRSLLRWCLYKRFFSLTLLR